MRRLKEYYLQTKDFCRRNPTKGILITAVLVFLCWPIIWFLFKVGLSFILILFIISIFSLLLNKKEINKDER
tara:strand:- start:867 stop:1082 length:216 start_codon:yes stop_codon:yes gene_type:complete